MRYRDLAVTQGLLAIRIDADTSDPRPMTVKAMPEVKARVAPCLDLQLVVFPQADLLRVQDGLASLTRALDRGVDGVGGIPQIERTMVQGRLSVETLCRLTADRGLPVDMHCAETDHPLSRHGESLADETIRHGLQDRVAASHLTAMYAMENYHVSKLIPLIAEAHMNVLPPQSLDQLMRNATKTAIPNAAA